jgi:methylthioribose-1-phosphate isomerase
MKELSPIEWNNFHLKVLDQTLLPFQKKEIICKDYEDVAKAIKEMKLRGAPLIGIVAALAMAMEVKRSGADSYNKLSKVLYKAGDELVKTRPTAVNLKWAVDRMLRIMEMNKERRIESLKDLLIAEANKIYREDLENNKLIGKYGAELIREKDNILTHCNAGALATAGYGTALGVIRAANAGKKKITVYIDETRPYFQGARLTVFEMAEEKIPHYLITDNMAGYFMSKGVINVVVVGADRITAGGDVANKIGTYSLAVLAYANKIPFYVAAPSSTVDFSIKTGDQIPIEMRSEEEVKKIFGHDITLPKTKALHPAFDVTPAKYVSAIITEKGVIRAPYDVNLEKVLKNREAAANL